METTDAAIVAAEKRIGELEGADLVSQFSGMMSSALSWASGAAPAGGGVAELRGCYTPEDSLFFNAPPGAPRAVDPGLTPKSFVGAVLRERWEVRGHIQGGAVGRGWVAFDKETKKLVFLKTFTAHQDRDNAQAQTTQMIDDNIRKEIKYLVNERLQSQRELLPPHECVVEGTRLCYGNAVVPATGASGDLFFCVSPDFCQGGELFEYILCTNAKFKGPCSFDERVACTLFKQIMSGVDHIHRNGVVHRDLKLENLICTSDYHVKLMDFGHAKLMSQMRTESGHFVTETKEVGTFAPPEKTGQGGYDPIKWDVWNCGVILLFLTGVEGLLRMIKKFGGMHAFVSKAMRRGPRDFFSTLEANLKKKGRPNLSPVLVDLIAMMLSERPEARPTTAVVLQHRWMQQPDVSPAELAAEMSRRYNGVANRDLEISVGVSADEAIEQVTAALSPEVLAMLTPPDEMQLDVQSDSGLLFIGDSYSVTAEQAADATVVTAKWIGGALTEWCMLVETLEAALQKD